MTLLTRKACVLNDRLSPFPTSRAMEFVAKGRSVREFPTVRYGWILLGLILVVFAKLHKVIIRFFMPVCLSLLIKSEENKRYFT